MRTFCVRYKLADGQYTCQFFEDRDSSCTIDEVRQIAEDVVSVDPRLVSVDHVYIMQENK